MTACVLIWEAEAVPDLPRWLQPGIIPLAASTKTPFFFRQANVMLHCGYRQKTSPYDCHVGATHRKEKDVRRFGALKLTVLRFSGRSRNSVVDLRIGYPVSQ